MLTVKSLGKFEVTDGINTLKDDVLRSDMLKKLLVYLMLHRKNPITIQELSEALWQEDEIENPAGAIKNLMYRLRNILKKTFGDKQYIITGQGTYAWNISLDISLDVERFESYYKKAKAEQVKQEMISDYESTVALYKGDFMENTVEQHWGVTLATYYHSMFLNAVKSLANLYLEVGRYQDVEDVCVYALKMDRVDEELYCYHIMALMKENKLELALKCYNEANSILYDALGVRNPSGLEKVQNELLKMSKGSETGVLENIQDDMIEDEDSQGVYFCGYPVFREIYRLEVRKNARLGEAEYVVLFTVELDETAQSANDKLEKFLIEKAMKNLKNSLKVVLRIGDVVARYSDSQFIALLPTCTYENSVRVAKRVLSRFESFDKSQRVKIKTEFEQLLDIKSTLVR